jgi:hypothetical protein
VFLFLPVSPFLPPSLPTVLSRRSWLDVCRFYNSRSRVVVYCLSYAYFPEVADSVVKLPLSWLQSKPGLVPPFVPGLSADDSVDMISNVLARNLSCRPRWRLRVSCVFDVPMILHIQADPQLPQLSIISSLIEEETAATTSVVFPRNPTPKVTVPELLRTRPLAVLIFLLEVVSTVKP